MTSTGINYSRTRAKYDFWAYSWLPEPANTSYSTTTKYQVLTYPQARTISEIIFDTEQIFCLDSEEPILYQSQKFRFPLSQYSLTPELNQMYSQYWNSLPRPFELYVLSQQIRLPGKLDLRNTTNRCFCLYSFWPCWGLNPNLVLALARSVFNIFQK